MQCQYKIIGSTPEGKNILRCLRQECNHSVVSAYGPELVHTQCRATRSHLVGDNLHNILIGRYQIGVGWRCRCKEWIGRMNEWGPEGCRTNLAKIVDALLSEAKRRNWALEGRPLLSAVARLGSKAPLGAIVARAWARRLVLEAIEQVGESHGMGKTGRKTGAEGEEGGAVGRAAAG